MSKYFYALMDKNIMYKEIHQAITDICQYQSRINNYTRCGFPIAMRRFPEWQISERKSHCVQINHLVLFYDDPCE